MKKTSIIAVALLAITGVAFAATTTLTFKTARNDSSTIAQASDALKMTPAEFATKYPNAQLNGNQTFTNTVTVPDPAPTPEPTPVPGSEIRFNAYMTAYTWWDNTPPGSADIALPVLHNKAGGTGTYADPITIAVGHVISGGKDTPDFPAGTRFYAPYLRAYFIVEDVCGDGNRPQNGPCHKGYPSNATAWLDMWIDGASVSKNAANNCAEAITETHLVIQNPEPNYAVIEGSIIQNGACRGQYGDTPVVQ